MSIKTLGQRIRELREQNDLSLRELAKKVGVSAAFLSDVELGRRYPKREEIYLKLSQYLETTVEDLRNYDTRLPIEDIKKLASSDPLYGIAFRKVIDNQITAKKLLELLEKEAQDKENK
jgi:transcriptional regulator with XRE-family HTH domain